MTMPMDRPTRPSNVSLAGEMSGSAYAQQQWLVQRGDRYLQLTEVLYRIAELSDGTHTPEEIAVLVAAMTRKAITADDVRALIAEKLIPAGVVNGTAPAPTTGAPVAPANPPDPPARSPLQVQLRAKVIGTRGIAPLAWLGSALYLPGIAIVAVLATVATRIWLYTEHGVARGVEAVFTEPGWLFTLGALAVASAAFHEIGHAAALRASGGQARGMGIGLYFIWPVFYTDVTDSYRLGRWGRIVTDLGGFYFNLIFSLCVLGAYVLTRNEALLVAVALVDLEIIHQTLPLGRLDGYWLLADIAGVPDFFAVAMPFLRRVGGKDGALPRLHPLANIVVALYLVLIIPMLVVLAWVVGRNVPHLAVTAFDAFLVQADHLEAALAARDLGAFLGAVGHGVLLVLPLLAILYFLFGIARTLARWFIAAAGRTTPQRLTGAAAAALAAFLVIGLWQPLGVGTVISTAASETAIPRWIDERLPELTASPFVPLRLPTPRAASSTPPASRPPATPAPRTVQPAVTTAAPTTAPTVAPTVAPTAPPTTAAPTPTPATTAPAASPTQAPAPTGGTP